MKAIEINGRSLTLDDVAAISHERSEVRFAESARQRVIAARDAIERFVREERTVYGITTGFGVFSDVHIEPVKVRELQRNLILSHCAGTGEALAPEQVRAMMLLRANALAAGYSGVRPLVIESLLALLNHDVVPVIPSQGSVGASGDLAPLAHLAGVLMGVGEVWLSGERREAFDGLAMAGLEPIEYEAKEGLAMINGTQAITAIGGLALHRASKLADLADGFAAMTLDALLGTDAAFDPRIHEARPHAGQVEVAARMRALLAGSGIRESHRSCTKVQDAYSLRCVPQVHGAVRDALSFAREKIEIEINSATDNPLIFADDDVAISGGNFHGAPVALACDVAAIALTDLASISERRIERLVNPALSDLPAFLVEEGGLNSGFMIAQVTAAALVSECKMLAHPASVDSIPTSANKEDHVSMGPIAARKLAQIVANLEGVLAIEAMCAAQAIDFRRPLKSSAIIESMHTTIREHVAHWDTDRYLHADIEAMRGIMSELWNRLKIED